MSYYELKYGLRPDEATSYYRNRNPRAALPDAQVSASYKNSSTNYQDMHKRYMQWSMIDKSRYPEPSRIQHASGIGPMGPSAACAPMITRPSSPKLLTACPDFANGSTKRPDSSGFFPPASAEMNSFCASRQGDANGSGCMTPVFDRTKMFVNNERYNPRYLSDAARSRLENRSEMTPDKRMMRDCGASAPYQSDLMIGGDDMGCGRAVYRDDGERQLDVGFKQPTMESLQLLEPCQEQGKADLMSFKKFSYLPTCEDGFMSAEDMRTARGTVRDCLIWRPHIRSELLCPPPATPLKAVGPHVRTDNYCIQRVRSILTSLEHNPYITSPTKVEDHVYIGSLSDAVDHRKLKRMKINFILDCAGANTSACHFPPNSGIVGYESIPAEDSCSHNMLQYVDQAVNFIDMVRRRNGRVLVHCIKGVNRSGFIIVAYLMLRTNKNLFQAVRRLKHCRGVVLTNPAFQKQLVMLARMHRKIQ